MQTPILRIETLTSPPITTQDSQIYLRSQLVQLRFPAVDGGFIWNRPAVVVVRTPDGQESAVRITDITRTILFGLVGLWLTGMFIGLFLRRTKT